MTKNRYNPAFTIVELIVVISVIAILAAITIVGYGAWQRQTLITQVKNDLSAAASAMEDARNFDNKYPVTVPATVKSSDAVDFVGGGNTQGLKYCISKTSASDPSIQYYITSQNRSEGPQVGDCSDALNVTTIAGSTAGNADGVGSSAQFNRPFDIAKDSAGALYVADAWNNRIRKITLAGVVTTLAGSSSGTADGTGTAARFYTPQGIAIDSAGVLYVTDTTSTAISSRIRKITPSGVVTTLAGSTGGYANGTGTAAQFYLPEGIAVDAAGIVYVADSGNQAIRKITPSGVVTTLAGSTFGTADGTGTAAQFRGPSGIVVDSSGTVYVTDTYRIRKITPSGVVTTLAGSTSGYADGTGAAAKFSSSAGYITIDASGVLYVVDSGNQAIRKITPSGVVTTLAGGVASGFIDGSVATARFYNPKGITIDGSGALYVVDSFNNRIRKIE